MTGLNTVGELIAELKRFPENATVRVATQPRYPLRCRVVNVAEPARGEHKLHDDGGVVWIAVDQYESTDRAGKFESPYAPRSVWGTGR